MSQDLELLNNFVIFQTDSGKINIDVFFKDETLWLTQKKMAELFEVKIPAISKHLDNIYTEGELIKEATVSILEIVQNEGKRKVKRKLEYYNLQAILAVGYRVNSHRAIEFRKWASLVLQEYIIKGFAMAVPSFEAEQIRDEVALFQAIKARINKFTPSGGVSDSQVETAVRQIVEEALASDGVVDVFEAAGMKTPTLDILSEEFLLEVKNMEQKNLAFELLRKLLNDEVKLRKRKNMAQGKKFSEMLESVINRYHNNQIDTAQVIQELSDIARAMKLEDKKAEDIGLTPEEYAFYSVLAQNDSTKFLDDHKMKELIHVIVDIIRKNATVDWEKREDVRAKLRLTVKKILMRYGYPPDLARIEADKVLEQSELLAQELTQ
jgi:type I site-specific restriction-modification system R (restriction) subunit